MYYCLHTSTFVVIEMESKERDIMGFIKDLIGLTITETACGLISSKLSAGAQKRRLELEEKSMEELKLLKELYDSGAISEREYKKKKKELMRRMP